MPKLITLVGGPDDGATIAVEENRSVHRVVKFMDPVGVPGSVIIGVKIGLYEQQGDRPGVQIFKWGGWEE